MDSPSITAINRLLAGNSGGSHLDLKRTKSRRGKSVRHPRGIAVQLCPEPRNARLEEELIRIEYAKRIVIVNQKEKVGAGGGT